MLRRSALRIVTYFAGIALAGAADQLAPFSTWENEIAAFEAADRAQPPAKGGVLFIGSSSIRLWTMLAADFPNQRVLNRGFGGSDIVDSTHFAERIIFPYAPRMIVLYAGGNGLNSGREPEQIIADFKAFVEKVRGQLPDVELAYISIAGNPARWAQVEKVKAVNAAIAAWMKDKPRMQFIDVFPHMLGADGLPLPDIFQPDRLHMNAAGYAIWTRIIAPYLPR